jgi:peptidoglycan/xylan/chitin deacetylase (PgdA/CDA1 family)
VTLLYHRVSTRSLDPWGLSVTPHNFSQHLEVLRDYRCMSLPQLERAIAGNKLPRRAVVVTFDDGYADNLFNAKPLLERNGISATVFVASGYLNHLRGFWWDDLEAIFLRPGELPPALSLSVGGREYEWDLRGAVRYSESDCDQHSPWRAWKSETPTARQGVYRSVYELMNNLSENERVQTVHHLLSWAGLQNYEDADNRALSERELRALSESGLVDIGCHTISHSRLSSLSLESQCTEIRGSKAQLEEVLERPVRSFAYPYGRACDYTEDTVKMVSESGFACAFAAEGGPIRRDYDLFQLPRVQVNDVSGDVFAAQLREWLNA